MSSSFKYVKDFEFPASFGFKTPGFAKGGSVSVKQCYAKGGKVAPGKIPSLDKSVVNSNDATSPGSSKRTPPAQSTPNKAAAKARFATAGKLTPPATKQTGNVERMTAYSDFNGGGSTKPAFNRLKNLGHYAHGGKVKGEKSSGSAKGPNKAAKAPKPKGSEPKAQAKMAGGGLTRGTNPKQRAAIHAKSKNKAPKKMDAGALAGALAAMAPPKPPMSPGMGAPPPGMAPGMGAPPGAPMGSPRPMPMGGAAPAMAGGGQFQVTHVHKMG